MSKHNVARREFLRGAAAGAGVAASAGMLAEASAQTHAQRAAADAPPLERAHSDNRGHDHQDPPSDPALRVMALESLLVEKGLVDSYEHTIGPRNGARVVARAWVDPEYKKRLLANATAAVAELGYSGLEGEHLVAVENTPEHHHLIVCTLCSCYPWPVLGLPPLWYKSAGYRARAVIDKRGLLRDLGLEIDERVELSVWDSTATIRYLVLPERPEGTERLSEAELAGLVTRDAMVGIAKVAPTKVQHAGGAR
jgi:nitrile hydratase subunit alpha